MPPLPIYPNQPAGGVDINWPSVYTSGGAGATPSAPGVGATTFQWDQYIATIQQAIKESSGWARIQEENRLKDAKAGRENAYKIAELSAKTSRYGTDQQTKMQLAQLQQADRHFAANHGLEMAKAYTQFAQTPDMMWAQADFKSALGNVSQGYSPAPIAASASPKPKTYDDFAALSNYPGGGGTNSGGNATADPGGRTGTDPRVSAANAVMKAIPPSQTPGNDGQDWAALRAIENLYMAGRPGEVERLGAPRRKIAQAGLARLGYSPELVEQDRMRALPGQGSVRAA
jgi:hypothetical protein